jgi:phosphoserine aminotransferase
MKEGGSGLSLWYNGAIKEAKFFGETVVVASSKEEITIIPKGYSVPADADYFHCK